MSRVPVKTKMAMAAGTLKRLHLCTDIPTLPVPTSHFILHLSLFEFDTRREAYQLLYTGPPAGRQGRDISPLSLQPMKTVIEKLSKKASY